MSTEEQTHGVSLAIQEAQCRALAAAHQVTLGDLITDDASGKSLKRPGIQRILEAMRARSIAGVFVWKLDRLTRSLRDLVHIMELIDANDVALVSLHERIDTSGPMGRFTLHLFGSLAQFERETISQRVKASTDHLRAKGCWTGGFVPPGCRRIGERGNYRLEPDPEPAKAVREAVRLYVAGAGLNACADILFNGGAFKKRPTATNVSRALLNPWLVSVGLISQEDAVRMSEIMSQRNPRNRRDHPRNSRVSHKTERPWPLRGLAFCGQCGAAIIGASGVGRGGIVHAYLRCAGRNRHACSSKDLPAGAWETAVIRKVCEAAKNGDWLRAWTDYAETVRQETANEVMLGDGLQTRLNANQAAAARILALVEGGGAIEAAKARLAELEREAATIREQSASIEAARASKEMAETDLATMTDTIAAAAEMLPAASPDQVRDILAGLVRRVVIRDNPAHITIELQLPRSTRLGVGGFVQNSHLVDRSGKNTNPGPTIRYQMRQIRRGQRYVVEDISASTAVHSLTTNGTNQPEGKS